jgi:hypothetical protein
MTFTRGEKEDLLRTYVPEGSARIPLVLLWYKLPIPPNVLAFEGEALGR